MVIMSTKEYNAALNKAYLDGYKAGVESGRREAMMSKVTTNELRKSEVNIGPPKIDWGIWLENMRCL